MHQLLCVSFLVLISCGLYAADHQNTVELEPEAANCEVTIEQATALPTEGQTFSPRVGACVALAAGGSGTILAVLGGVGTGLTCPDASAYAAAQFLCAFSITGLTLGGLFLIAAIGTTVVVLVKNNAIESEN